MATQQQKHAIPRKIIDDFVSSLPKYIRCTSDFNTGLWKPTLKSTALTHDYIQFNEANCIEWLVFDIDKGWESALAWDFAGICEPNFILQNPVSGNCHYFYRLITPVYLKTGEDSQVRSAPEDYLNAIKVAMTTALGADTNYTHQICKNPLSAKWRVLECHTSAFELSELAKHLTLKSKLDTFLAKRKKLIERRFARNDPRYVQGRNCALFDDLRLYAYSFVNTHKASNGRFDSFQAELFDYANDLNQQFSPALPISEIKSTVKSVAKWTWKYFTGSGNRGVMGFGDNRFTNPAIERLSTEEMKRRQRASAERTNAIRKSTTEEKINAAIDELKVAGAKINNCSIAKKAGVVRQTVMAFFKRFGGEKSVNYAVNQVVEGSKGILRGVDYLLGLFCTGRDIVIQEVALAIEGFMGSKFVTYLKNVPFFRFFAHSGSHSPPKAAG
jgi:Replicase family/Primase C terminal 1 (PriCT-1)